MADIEEYIDDTEEVDDEDSAGLYEHFKVVVDRGQKLTRVDKFLLIHLSNTSRNRVQKAADSGFIMVNGKPVKRSYKVKPFDVIQVMLDRPHYDTNITAEDIPLDIVYEDDDLMVVNKPAGLVVHPGFGNWHGTLLNAIAWHLKDHPEYDINDPEIGLVHRIDKDTSGLLIVAKNDFAHTGLAEQIKEHSFTREYEAVVFGNLKDDSGTVDAPIGRNPNDRKKMCVTEKNSKNAVTHYSVIERYRGYTHIKCRLETGRTHQIRVHMAYLGHPVAGDLVYGVKKEKVGFEGQCLHAKKIGFVHPRSKEYLEFNSELPQYFAEFLEKLKKISA